MNEREHHIKVLEQFLHDYQEWGEDLELEKTIKYTISSLKTDLKYDLMYEGEDVYTKDDLVAMLEEIKTGINYEFHDDGGYYADKDEVDIYIQQKINSLKEAQNDREKDI